MKVTDEITSRMVDCPACGLDSMYSREMDRYVHMSGSRNDACWEFISSGQSEWFRPTAFDIEPETFGRCIKVTRGSQVKMQPIRWWEHGIVLAAAINLLAGREGKGKSTVAAAWAAKETREGGTVLWIGTEESREHAQAPRLKAAGADMDRIVFVDVAVDMTTHTSLIFPLDLPALEKVIEEHQITMMILDPCKGLVPTDFRGNDDVAVRQYLEPIAALCSRRDIVMIGLMHFGKRESNDSGKLILGSVAWSQVARSVISIAEDEESDTRVITNTKTNFTDAPRSLEFRIVNVDVHTEGGTSSLGAVEWIGETTKDARDLLGGDQTDDDDAEERTAAEYWLEDYLYLHGPKPSKEVKAAANKEKISERTLQRAKKRLGIIDSSEGFPRTTIWNLPQSRQSDQPPLRHGATGATGATGPDQHKQNGATVDDSTVAPVAPPPRIYGATVATAVATGATPGNGTASTPGQTDRVAAALAKTSKQPNCAICQKPVVAGQGDTHLSCKGTN